MTTRKIWQMSEAEKANAIPKAIETAKVAKITKSKPVERVERSIHNMLDELTRVQTAHIMRMCGDLADRAAETSTHGSPIRAVALENFQALLQQYAASRDDYHTSKD